MKRLQPLVLAGLLVATLLSSTISALVSAAPQNLISNPSAETVGTSGQPAAWTPGTWGTSSTTLQTTTNAHSGNVALNITSTSRTSGDAKWSPDPVAVTAGTQYTYSDYYEASASSELDAAFSDASGNVSYAYLTTVSASAGWQQTTVSFTAPATAKQATILHILPTSGNLTIDDVSLSAVDATPPVTGNAVNNPSLETANGQSPANWQIGSWGSNNASFSYNQTGHTGAHSVTTSITSYTDGDAKWYADPISVTAGQTYTYSDFYTSSAVTRIVIAYNGSAGTSYAELPQAATAASWTNYSAQLTVPTGANSITIYHLLDRVGSLTIDDVSLTTATSTPTPPSNPAPLTIANPSVETSANGTSPDSWQSNAWGNNDASFSYPSDGHTGSKSVKVAITNYTDGDAKWYFTPVTGLQNGASYHFSAWIKSNTQVHAVAAFTMTNGTTTYDTLGLPLGTNATDWHQYTTDFTAPTGAQSATVYLLISSAGWAQTDDYSLTTYTPAGFSEGLVSLDFDDGWRNIYANGLPLLQKYNLPSTQYIISGKIGTSLYMTKAQIKAFQAQGSEIGSHSVTHPDLTTVSAAQLQTELSQSQATLRADFGNSVASEFATPYGSYNDAVLNSIQQYYVSHRSTDAGFNSKDNFNPYNIVVQNVTATTTNAQVKAWVDQALSQKLWLVLVYHQVENTVAAADVDAVKTANLNTQLSYIKSSGIAVKTQAAALAEVKAQL